MKSATSFSPAARGIIAQLSLSQIAVVIGLGRYAGGQQCHATLDQLMAFMNVPTAERTGVCQTLRELRCLGIAGCSEPVGWCLTELGSEICRLLKSRTP